jgi:hypothetical protein
VTMVSREETMPATSSWNSRIVLIASTISNGQSGQTEWIDRIVQTGLDTISSWRKAMQIEERGQASPRRAPAPNRTCSRHFNIQTTPST